MPADLLLGLDVGTTFSKAAAVTADGVERGHGSVRTPWRPVPTGAEIDPGEMADAAASAAREALAAAGGGRVLAVGVTGMAETGVLLAAGETPAVPSIVWHDTRGEEESVRMAEALGAAEFVSRTGLPPTRLCSLAKYRWMRRHWPGAEAGVRWLNVGEWMVRALGGEETAELSLASRTGFLDVGRGAWWDEALAWAEAPRGLLPEPRPAGSPAGTVSRLLPEAAGATLAVTGHDHSCAALGAGAVEPGDVFDSCGTAEAFVRAVDPPVPGPAVELAVAGGVTVGHHVLPGRWVLLGGFRSGLVQQRMLDLLGVTDAPARERLDAMALALPPGAEGVRVESVVEDEASVTGIPLRPSPGHVWRATLEAVARYGRGVVETIESVGGETARLVVSGGGARSPAVRAVKREVLGPFVEPLVTEAGARGAALLAGVAAGLFAGPGDLPAVRWRDDG